MRNNPDPEHMCAGNIFATMGEVWEQRLLRFETEASACLANATGSCGTAVPALVRAAHEAIYAVVRALVDCGGNDCGLYGCGWCNYQEHSEGCLFNECEGSDPCDCSCGRFVASECDCPRHLSPEGAKR